MFNLSQKKGLHETSHTSGETLLAASKKQHYTPKELCPGHLK